MLGKNDVWLAHIGAAVLPTLYEAYQEIIASFRDVPASADGKKPSKRYSLAIPAKLQANAAALLHLSSILDLSVDCCDLEETCSAKFLPSFIQATGAILLGTKFDDQSSDQQRRSGACSQSKERYACDVLRRIASFSLANIVDAVPSCLQGAIDIFQQRHGKLMLAIQNAPEISIQRSLISFTTTVYKEGTESSKDSQFVADMDYYLANLEDEASPKRTSVGRALFKAIDLNDDVKAMKRVEKFRLFLNEVAFEEGSPATRCIAMQSCHVFMGPKCDKGKEGPMALARIDWNLRGICVRLEKCGGEGEEGDPLHICYSQMIDGELAADGRELSFETKGCRVPFLRVQLSSAASRLALKDQVLPRLTSENVNVLAIVPSEGAKYHVTDDNEGTPILYMKRKASTPVSEAQPFAPHHRKPEGIQAFSDTTASTDAKKAETENLDSVFAGLKPDGFLLLPPLDDNNKDSEGRGTGNGVGEERKKPLQSDSPPATPRVHENTHLRAGLTTEKQKKKAMESSASKNKKKQAGISKTRRANLSPARSPQVKPSTPKPKKAKVQQMAKATLKRAEIEQSKNLSESMDLTESPQFPKKSESAPSESNRPQTHNSPSDSCSDLCCAVDEIPRQLEEEEEDQDTDGMASSPGGLMEIANTPEREERHDQSPEPTSPSESGSSAIESVEREPFLLSTKAASHDLIAQQKAASRGAASAAKTKAMSLTNSIGCDSSSDSEYESDGDGSGDDDTDNGNDEDSGNGKDNDNDSENLFIRKLAMVVRATLDKHKAKSAALQKAAEEEVQRHRDQFLLEEDVAAKKLGASIAAAAVAQKEKIQKHRRRLQAAAKQASSKASGCRKAIGKLAAELGGASARHKAQTVACTRALAATGQELRATLSGETRAAASRKRKRSTKSSKSDALLAGLSNLLGRSV